MRARQGVGSRISLPRSSVEFMELAFVSPADWHRCDRRVASGGQLNKVLGSQDSVTEILQP